MADELYPELWVALGAEEAGLSDRRGTQQFAPPSPATHPPSPMLPLCPQRLYHSSVSAEAKIKFPRRCGDCGVASPPSRKYWDRALGQKMMGLSAALLLLRGAGAQSAPVEMVWARQFGNMHSNNAAAVMYNESVGLVVAGFTRTGTGAGVLAGDIAFSEMFSGVDGAIVRRKEFGSAEGIDHANALARGKCPVSPTQCGFYVAGTTTGVLSNVVRIGPVRTPGASDIFVAEFAHAGTSVGARQMGSSAQDEASGIARIPPGFGSTLWATVIVGKTYGDMRPLAIVPPAAGTAAGSGDAYVMQLTDGATNPEWVFQFGDPATLDAANAVAVDGQRFAYVVGLTYGSIGSGCVAKGSMDAFVVQVDMLGRQRWCDQIGATGTTSRTEAHAVAYANACDTLFVVGSTQAALGKATDAFISRYSSNGELLWTKQDWLGLTGSSVARAVATGPGCRAYVSGTFHSPAVANVNSVISFVSVWSAGGVELLSKTFAAVETKTAKDGFSTVFADTVAYAPPRDVYVAGKADGSIFGQPAISGLDAFVVKFNVPSEPGTIGAVIATDIGSNALEIKFTQPSTQGSALTGFQVELSKNGVAFGVPIDVQVGAADAAAEEKIVLGLSGIADTGDRCVVRVRAVNLFGPAEWSLQSNEVVVGAGGSDGQATGRGTAAMFGGGVDLMVALYIGLGALGCLIPCALILASIGIGSIFVYRHLQHKKASEIERDQLIGGRDEDEDDGLEMLEELGVPPDAAAAAYQEGKAALDALEAEEEITAERNQRILESRLAERRTKKQGNPQPLAPPRPSASTKPIVKSADAMHEEMHGHLSKTAENVQNTILRRRATANDTLKAKMAARRARAAENKAVSPSAAFEVVETHKQRGAVSDDDGFDAEVESISFAAPIVSSAAPVRAHNARPPAVKSSVDATASELPAGWEALEDATSKKVYYVNRAERRKQWHYPGTVPASTSKASAAASASPNSAPAALSAREPPLASSLAKQSAHDQADDAAHKPLPPGWERLVDVSRGNRPYYVHREQRLKQWNRPGDEAVAAIGASARVLPPGWVEMHSAEQKRKYYIHKEKALTQWDHPAAPNAAESTAALDSIKALASDAGVLDLAEGWVEKFDAKKQKPYYVNAAQRKTQWIRPISASAPVSAAAAEKPAATSPAGALSAPAASPINQSTASVVAVASAVKTALPPGWVEKFDPKRNKSYYVNAEKRATQWVRPTTVSGPAAAADAVVSTLPEGWVEKFDVKKQKPYYVNATKRVTQWVRPTAEVAPGAGESTAALDSIKALALDAGVSDLAEGWVEKFDAKKQKPYYVNAAQRKTQWIRPISASAPVSVAVAEKPAATSPAGAHSASATSPVKPLATYVAAAVGDTESELPEGWVEKFDDTQHHRPYYVNAAKKITQWVRPIASSATVRDVTDGSKETATSEGGSDAAASGAVAAKPDKSQAKAMRRAGKKVVKSNEERRESLRKAHGHDKTGLWTDVAQAHKVRWTRPKRRADQTYASILLGDDARDDVEDLLDQMFTVGDKTGSGVLTNMGLNSMVRRRAKGGRLHGNLFAQMHLSKQLDPDDAHAITREMFTAGMLRIMQEDPNGAVAEWIWLEFDNMEEASTDTEDRSGTESEED